MICCNTLLLITTKNPTLEKNKTFNFLLRNKAKLS